MKTARVAHPILQHSAWNVPLSGFIEVREQRERTDRIVVRVHSIEGRLRDAPERVRLSVKKRTAPPVGTFVQVTARLNPPLRPLRPGGYDFSRDLYFQRIGATGFVTGAIRIAEPPVPPSAWVRYATAIAKMRAVIDTRIRAALSGDEAAIASALLTGTRDAISAPVNDALFISGLGHVLSISGYHLMLPAGNAADTRSLHHHRGKDALDSREREWWAKGPSQVLRLAGTLCYLDWAMDGGPEPQTVEARFIEAAVRLWRDYFWPHSRAAIRQIGLTDHNAEARRVLRWIRAGRRDVVSREDVRRDALSQRLKLTRCDGINELVQAGWHARGDGEGGRCPDVQHGGGR